NTLDVLGARGPKHLRTNFGRLEEPLAVPAEVLAHGGEPRGPTQRLEIAGVLEGDLEPLGKGDLAYRRGARRAAHLRFGPFLRAEDPGIAEGSAPDQDAVDLRLLHPRDEILDRLHVAVAQHQGRGFTDQLGGAGDRSPISA